MCVCLRASTPVVEDDQDIGESNASVSINIGGAFIIVEAEKLNSRKCVIFIKVPITVDITIHVGVHGSASAEAGFSLIRVSGTIVYAVVNAVTISI